MITIHWAHPNFSGSNIVDCYRHGSDNSWTTAMLWVHNSFGQILFLLMSLHSWPVSVIKNIWEKKKGVLKTTKKVLILTHDWVNLTANLAPMNDSAEGYKGEWSGHVPEYTSWILCSGTGLLCDLQQVTWAHIHRSILKSISSGT